VGDLDSFIDELGEIEEELESSTLNLPALVAEFVPLNRRRVHGDPPLSVAELERWMELRELLEYEFGSANPPLGGTRRRQLRVPTHLKVRTAGRGDAVSNLCDVSEGGAFIETSEMLAPGTPLKLEIDPGNGEPPLQLDAVVKWGREISNMDGSAGVGVEFENIEDGDFAVLEAIVDRALDSVSRDRS
jgi:uncharacterized protein (TIGR02266 family)